MEYLERRINKANLVKEIIFDFEDKQTRVENGHVFLKVKETPTPLEVGSIITFTKTFHYSNDMSEDEITMDFPILSINNGVVEIDNPSINELICCDVMEYSKYDEEMDDNDTKLFNYLTQNYDVDKNYFVLTFANPHYIAENETFNLKLSRPSLYTENNYVYLNTENELPEIGVKNTVYYIKYKEDGIEPVNIMKHWVMIEGADEGYYDDLTPDLLSDLTTKNKIETHFYKHFGLTIDEKKLQIILEGEDYNEWFNHILESKIHATFTLENEEYDDRMFFKECGEKVILSNNVKSTVISNFLGFNLMFNKDEGLNLHQETLLKSEYVDDVINTAIPEINDYEKNIVKPSIKTNNGFKRASQIIFNLHFRNRIRNGVLTENWDIVDNGLWNGYGDKDKWGENKSDLLYYLGFTSDDVYYQKMKLQKSFLRLSFYDSDEPTNQQLLFYSTVFIDAGDLYGKYNVLKTQLIDGKVNGYDSESNIMTIDVEGHPRLSSQFIVTDRFNTYKSSEGFYLYLFNKTLPKKLPETIYMRVDFNHAKYGKTIPFLYFGENDIRLHYVEKGKRINMMQYFKDLHIKLQVIYDEESRSYVYYLPDYENDNGTDIILNLFEPRVNGDGQSYT